MDSFSDKARESAGNAAGDYVSYAIIAQQELFQLGMNFFQRQIGTGRKIAASRDFVQAVGAWTELANETMEDFSAATTRLLNQAHSASRTFAQDAEEDFRAGAEQATQNANDGSRATEQAAQKIKEGIRGSADQTKRMAEAVTGQRRKPEGEQQ